MALIAGTSLANRAGQYLVASSVNAIAEQIRQEIGNNLTAANLGQLLSRILPGKGNKSKRAAVKQKLQSSRMSAVSRRAAAPLAYNYSPNFRVKQGTNNFRVKNREFVAEVVAGTTYKVNAVTTLQPGVPDSFPWLSQIATNHQKYKFHNVRYSYVPSTGATTAGRIIMAYSPDPLDTFPVSQNLLYQYPIQTDSTLWSECNLEVPANNLKTLFTRSTQIPDTDIKTYDNGVLFVSTYGAGAEVTTGTLFVEYEVELINPQPKQIVNPLNIQITPPFSDAFWFQEFKTVIPNQPYSILRLSDSTGIQFLQTGWWCVRTFIYASTTDSVDVDVIRNCDVSIVENVIQTGVRVYTEFWVNVKQTNSGDLAHIRYDFGSMAGVGAVTISVNPMNSGAVTPLST